MGSARREHVGLLVLRQTMWHGVDALPILEVGDGNSILLAGTTVTGVWDTLIGSIHQLLRIDKVFNAVDIRCTRLQKGVRKSAYNNRSCCALSGTDDEDAESPESSSGDDT